MSFQLIVGNSGNKPYETYETFEQANSVAAALFPIPTYIKEIQ